MKFVFSKEFDRTLKKQSGKHLESLKKVFLEVRSANNISEISNCKKLTDFASIYRIRIGSQRAFFHFHIKVEDDTVHFLYLVSRGQAYAKEMLNKLRKKDGLKM